MARSAFTPILRRLRRRTVRLVGGVLRRPAFRVGIVIMFLALISAWFLNQLESVPPKHLTEEEWPYATYWGTVQQVGILLFSGYDAERPQFMTGYVLTMICTFLGIGMLALVTADLASILVTMAIAGAGHTKIKAKGHFLIHGWHYTTRVLIEQMMLHDDWTHREVIVIDEDLANAPVYDPDVHFLRGDPTEIEMLKLASVETAETAIVPIDWKLPESLQDSRTTLSVMAIKSVRRDLYTCAEVLRPQNRCHIERAGVDETVCLGELSQMLLSHAAITHGIARLMEQLLTSKDGNEIYRVALPACLAGQSFRWLLNRLNRTRGDLLLSVQRGVAMHTNPQGEFLLHDGDQLLILAAKFPQELESLAPSPSPS